MTTRLMAARTFEDSSGAVWEVIEVHRSSTARGAVSDGLEGGWLSFVSGDTKRRLGPFPRDWATAPVPELERLCALARAVPVPKYPLDPASMERRRRERASGVGPDTGPRRRADDHGDVELRAGVAGGGVAGARAPADADDGVEATVRQFAHEARARGLPAVGAMVELKLLLLAKFPEPDSEARVLRSVRRWFVETYYFERNPSEARP